MATRSKPLLFGESLEKEVERAFDASSYAAEASDPAWIPGYSEMIRARDILKAEYGSLTFRQRDKLLRDLGVTEYKAPSVDLMWGRVVGLDGQENDNVRLDMRAHKRDGYRVITKSELEALGYSVPESAHVEADGTIRRGDVALMAVDAERASANDKRRREEAAEREGQEGTFGSETGTFISVEAQRDRDFTLS